ncbi:germ cell nuclear acidic protein isoform X2 [Phlebotomus argentipes]|nr:germ cell nuclear acidic protein isoform X2 [Phlebotomus argentipes]
MLGRRCQDDQKNSVDDRTQEFLFEEDKGKEKSNILTDDESGEEELPEETNCSELNTQMSLLGIKSPPKKTPTSNIVKSVEKIKKDMRDLGIPTQNSANTLNMPSLNITSDERLSEHLRREMEMGNEGAEVTILTISSTNVDEVSEEEDTSQEVAEDTPEIIVLEESSEDELPLKDSDPIVSELNPKESLSSTVEHRLNAFFDKIPSIRETLSPHYSANKLLSKSTDENIEKSPAEQVTQVSLPETEAEANEEINKTEQPTIREILAKNTDETIGNSPAEPITPVSLPETEAEADEEDKKTDSGIEKGKNTTKPTNMEEKSQIVNISAKIRINIEIEECEVSSSSEESDQNNDDGDEGAAKQPDKKSGSFEINEEMEKILNDTYGDAWKTKEVLSSLKKKNVDKNKTNYNVFQRDLRTDLESTRFDVKNRNSPVTRPKDTPKNTPKTTPRKQRRVKDNSKYKRLLQICDSDTESEAEGDFSSDSQKSWQQSGSESSSAESSPHEKPTKKNVRRKVKQRKNLDFTQNASSDSDNTIFENRSPTRGEESREFSTPKDKIFGTEDKPQPSTKRKLFSKKLYEQENEIRANDGDGERRGTFKPVEDEVIAPLPSWLMPFKTPKPINKKLDAVKKASKTTTPKKTPDRATESPVHVARDPRKCYGFLVSLNPTTVKHLADPVALHLRENYRVAKEELTTKLYELYNEEVFDKKLKVGIRWNKKLLTTAGRCTNMSRNGVRLAEIDLSEKVLTSADRLRCTLIHELCHAAAWIFDGEKKGHAMNWKKWASRANTVFPELPKITVSHQYNIEYKYTYQCMGCGAKTQMHSKAKKVENIQCKYCKGAIQVFLNKKNKEGEVVRTPVREVSGFAKFVKEKYRIFKTPQNTHAETMKILSQEFAKINLDKKLQ